MFPQEDRDEIAALYKTRNNIMLGLCILTPFLGVAMFTRLKYLRNIGGFSSLAVTGFSMFLLGKAFVFPTDRTLCTKYETLYDKYRFEVLNPKYRGLKLTKGKLPSQILKEGETSSKFQELRQMVMMNIKSK